MTQQLDLVAQLFADGLLNPNEVQVAAVASGMVQQIMRSSYSMSVADAEHLLNHALRIVKEAKKRNDPDLDTYRRSVQAARAFLKYRRELERMRPGE